jgi:hypothetical protein
MAMSSKMAMRSRDDGVTSIPVVSENMKNAFNQVSVQPWIQQRLYSNPRLIIFKLLRRPLCTLLAAECGPMVVSMARLYCIPGL